MRAIDADKLLRKMQKVATEAWKMKMKAPNVETIWNQAIDYVKMAETIELPEIIHCKDCKHCADDRNGYEPTLACELTYCGVLPDNFCSWAEPREESNDQ